MLSLWRVLLSINVAVVCRNRWIALNQMRRVHPVWLRPRRICVIGGGVIGLPTAYRLQSELPNVHVTVISEEFSPNTTGDESAGFCRPYFVEGTPQERIRKWAGETFEHLLTIANTPEGGGLGVFLQTGYDLYRNPNVKEEFWRDVVLGYRRMTDQELKMFSGGYKCGYAYTTVMCECKTYLPWLFYRFMAIGGTCIQKKINTLADVSSDYDVIVTCPGVEARDLLSDETVEPLKGQLIKVEAPWIKHFVNAEEDDLYILGGSTTVALGGTHERGDWTTTIDQSHRERIWQGCCRLMPSLTTAKVVGEWAGFRPGRPSIRLEKEQIQINGRTVHVVHNYGHGGSGVTLHWGCAGDAVKLVRDILETLESKR